MSANASAHNVAAGLHVRRARWGQTHQNYFRDYDPAIGRYVESDPIGLDGGSYSTYVYVDGNPVAFVDPLGYTRYIGFPPDKETQMKAAVEEAKKRVRECKSQPQCFEKNGRDKIIKILDTSTYFYRKNFLGCGVTNPKPVPGNLTLLGPAAFEFSKC